MFVLNKFINGQVFLYSARVKLVFLYDWSCLAVSKMLQGFLQGMLYLEINDAQFSLV